jgi:prenyltransferase beta subunit
LKKAFLVASFFGAVLAVPSGAQDGGRGVYRGDFDLSVKTAVERGLAWLVSRQNPDGSWNNRVGYKLYEDYYGEENESIDVTALSCMSLVSNGHVPGRGKYGRNVALGVNWLLSRVRDEDGYVTHAGSRMYSHAFATLFLAEIYGMTRQPEIKSKLKRAVELIVNSQNREGGWRYQPIPVDADLSVTVSTLQALRAARNVGIVVPLETVRRAANYVQRCATRRGFSYQSVNEYGMNDTRVSYALTACGVVSMFSAGQYDSREIRDAIRVLPIYRQSLIPGRLHYYYGHYYASQAMYLAGGDDWARYYPVVKGEILKMQFADGHWEDDVGRTYATAMACIILQMPCEYLPIFQK